jgi:hypothetical protein
MNVGFDVLQLMNNAAGPLDNDDAFVREGTTVTLNQSNSEIFLEARDVG